MTVDVAARSARIAASAVLARKNRFSEAEGLLRDILRDQPGDIEALAALGAVALGQSDVQRAQEIFAHLVERAPARADFCAGLAQSHRLTGDIPAAIHCMRRAIDLNAMQPEYRIVLAELLLQTSDLLQANAEAGLALRQAPDRYEAQMVAGLAAIALAEPDRAEDHFRKAAEIRPDEPEPLNNLAELTARRGQIGEALHLAEAAYLIDPGNVSLMLGYATRLFDTGATRKAADLLERAAALAPANLPVQELRARCRLRLEGPQKPIVDFATYASRSKTPAAMLALARLLREAGRLGEALALGMESLRTHPGDLALLTFTLDCAMTAGDFDIVRRLNPADVPMPSGFYIDEAELVETGAGVLLVAARFLVHDGLPVAPLFAEGSAAALLSGVAGIDLRPLSARPADALPLSAIIALGMASIAQMPPNQPYLAADPERLARWHAALDSHPRPRVGILWHDAEGEPGIGVLAEVVAGLATPVSLAIGAMRETLSGHPEILDGGAHIDGPADLIAAIAALDAVVVVDALAAAIGGALGKPGLVLVPPAARWIWARKDDHTLWFPSLEPTAPADRATGWDAMVPALRARLVEITGEPRSPEPPNREHPV